MTPAEKPGPDSIVGELSQIFEQRGAEAYLGEAVTMAEHMLQAATLAERNGETEIVIAAALLHDVGHFVGPHGSFSMTDTEDRHHHASGAALLDGLFPEALVDCVRHHVAAKRYLCATNPTYYDRLSEASKHSLSLQGGPMSEAEAADFAGNPNLEAILQVRYLDDAGKRAGARTQAFTHFLPLLEHLVAKRNSSA
ncbi:MAG: HD domain-containing protein [Kiloniellales bacterium]